jgi:hypothetical protein
MIGELRSDPGHVEERASHHLFKELPIIKAMILFVETDGPKQDPYDQGQTNLNFHGFGYKFTCKRR